MNANRQALNAGLAAARREPTKLHFTPQQLQELTKIYNTMRAQNVEKVKLHFLGRVIQQQTQLFKQLRQQQQQQQQRQTTPANQQNLGQVPQQQQQQSPYQQSPQTQQQQQQQQKSQDQTSNTGIFTPQQLNRLKAQILTFKNYISAYKFDIPPTLLNAIKGVDVDNNLKHYETGSTMGQQPVSQSNLPQQQKQSPVVQQAQSQQNQQPQQQQQQQYVNQQPQSQPQQQQQTQPSYGPQGMAGPSAGSASTPFPNSIGGSNFNMPNTAASGPMAGAGGAQMMSMKPNGNIPQTLNNMSTPNPTVPPVSQKTDIPQSNPPKFKDKVPHPEGLDIAYLQEERERLIKIRVQNRIKQLEQIINSTTKHDQEFLKNMLEFKKLQLLEFQQRVRREIFHEVKAAPNTSLSNSVLKRKGDNDRDRQSIEYRQRRADMTTDSVKNQKQKKFMNDIMSHRRKFYDFFKNNKKSKSKVNKELVQHWEALERQEKQRREKQEKERLKALKENNAEEYFRLLEEAKEDRLMQLLKQTDVIMRQLGAQLITTQEEDKTKEEAEKEMEGEKGPDASAKPDHHEKSVYEEYLKNQKAYYTVAHKFQEEVTKQPAMLTGGELKPYQMTGLQWLVSLYNNRLNGILADEMGLGKTIQTISLLSYLMERKAVNGPHLVIVPLSTLDNWKNEFEAWAPDIQIVRYGGNQKERKHIQTSVLKERKFNVLITQYEFVSRDKKYLKKIDWDYIIIDEGHRIKNANSKLVQDLGSYRSKHRLLLTGTPLQNDLKELWSLLHFLLPKIFDNSLNFETWFSTPFNSLNEQVDLTEEEQLLIINRLHQVLRPFLLRREKSEVEDQLPEKVEKVIRCDLSGLQKLLYTQITEKGKVLVSGQSKGVKSLNNTVMELRKVCNHPFLVLKDSEDFSDDQLIRASGKFELLDRILPKLHDAGHRVLLFSQMTNLLDMLEYFLTHRGYRYTRLDGSVHSSKRGELVDQFNQDESIFLFLLSTRAGGQGLNLQVADTVVIFDSDWNPQQDLQAQARVHRIGQQKAVRVFVLVTANSCEEKIRERAIFKRNSEAKVIHAGMFNQKSTQSEREELLMQMIKADSDKEHKEIPDDDELNEILARDPNEIELFSKMDQERIEQERRLYTDKGLPVPNHLLDLEECPDWIRNADTAIEEKDNSFDYGRGRRRRRDDVNYDFDSSFDQMLVETGEINPEDVQDVSDETPIIEEEKPKRGRGRRKRGRPRTRPIDSSDEPPSKKRRTGKRGRVKKEESIPTASKTTPGRGRGRGRKKASEEEPPTMDLVEDVDGVYLDTDEISTDDSGLSTKMDIFLRIYHSLTALKSKETHRRICELFLDLPSKRLYPGYYKLIKNPLCLNQILHRIKQNQYDSIDQMQQDMALLCKNAQTFNQEGSVVYNDSVIMWKKFLEFKEQYMPSSAPESSDAENSLGDSLASSPVPMMDDSSSFSGILPDDSETPQPGNSLLDGDDSMSGW